MFSSNNTCERYWDDSDWLSPTYILERWCRQDERCWHAKQQALFSACKRGEVEYCRSDGKTFDDPIEELARRRILMIERASFETWVIRLDGHSPLVATVQPPKLPPRPAWADDCWSPQQALPEAPRTVNRDLESADSAVAADGVNNDATSAKRKSNVTFVPSADIIHAFRVKDEESENAAWWDQRMRDAKRYGLVDARVARGRLQNPSCWRPDLIAFWLIEKGHLPTVVVNRVLQEHFPDWVDTSGHLDD